MTKWSQGRTVFKACHTEPKCNEKNESGSEDTSGLI